MSEALYSCSCGPGFMVSMHQPHHGDSHARDRNPPLERLIDICQSSPLRFNHVEETHNSCDCSTSAEQEIGAWYALLKKNRAGEGDKKITDPIGACRRS